MSFFRLLLANLTYHRRGNLAVGLGVAVGTAVLTGALLVGDSLRGSLRELTLEQLGWVDHALVGGRFFRQELATKLPADHVAPAILLQATAAKAGDDNSPVVRKVVLLGVNQSFWAGEPVQDDSVRLGGMPAGFWAPPPDQPIDLEKRGVILNEALAQDLGVKVGDRVTFTVEKVSAAPRESVLGRRGTEDVLAAMPFVVAAVLPMEQPGGRFSLNPSPGLPRNAFVPLLVLQDELRAQEQRARTLPAEPVNALLAAGGNSADLQAALKEHMTLEDWGLALRKPRKKFGIPAAKYLSLESTELFLPPAVVQSAGHTEYRAADTLVYLVNNLTTRERELGAVAALLAPPGAELTRPALGYYGPVDVPYSVVAGLDPALQPPLGPFLPSGVKGLKDDEILLVDWDASPLTDVPAGASVVLRYFEPGGEGKLDERAAVFRVAGHLPLTGAANDPYLTPQFPGITDRLTLAEWDPPFPFDQSRIRPRDETYWSRHRTTPKAYVTLAAARKLWGGRYGDVTSVRIAPPDDESEGEIAREILYHLDPEQGGFRFDDVRAGGLQASLGGLDFGMLFLGFSFFLILAALLLVGLLVRLNIDRRASEIGLLLAVGHATRRVRRLLLAEGLLLALAGAVVGVGVGVLYARLLLDYLRASWPDERLDRSFLTLHLTPASLLIGYASAVVVSVLTIWWAVRVLGKVAPRDLIAGQTAPPAEALREHRYFWNGVLIVGGIIGAAGCFALGLRATEHEAQAGSFLVSGMLLLTAGLALAWRWLTAGRHRDVTRGGWRGLALLGTRNAGRNPVRSLLTIGLLASATFLVVAVQAFHRDPTADFLERDGGSGGFALLAEADVPVYQNLNDPAAWQSEAEDNGNHATSEALRGLTFYPFRVKQGDDVSCLNLYRPREPRVFGVPDAIIRRGGFRFAGTEADTEAEQANPWLLLTEEREDGAVPVFGEANTVLWVLKSGLGGTVTVTDGRGQPVKLRIVGLLRDSVFQGELLTSDAHFRRLYPRQEGFAFFLIDGAAAREKEVRTTVERELAPYGVAVTPTVQRLQSYLAVENTYLATFQALGGLGLLLGALGLAVVLLRGVWERRGELALLRALGLRPSALGWLVLAENAALLLAGLGIGTVAALLSVAPHVFAGAAVRWWQLAGLLLLVIVVGLLAGTLAVASTLRAPLLPALRKD